MILRLIKTDEDYTSALGRIEQLFTAKSGTPEGDELDLLITLVDLYEAKTFPISMPDPISAIKFSMEQQGLKAKDLIPYIGSGPRVSEVLSGKRPLSLNMIRKLTKGLQIPLEVLIQETGRQAPRTRRPGGLRNRHRSPDTGSR